MFKNYVKVALRNMRRYKLYTAINILGLTVALTSSLLILLYVYDEFHYDGFHEKADRIVRICYEYVKSGETHLYSLLPHGSVKMLTDELPEAELGTKMVIVGAIAVKYKDIMIDEGILIYADDSFFDVFTYKFLSGTPATALDEPYSVVLTKSSADKYFGDEPALGKTLIFDQKERYQNQPFKVTGVIEDLPHNTNFRFNMILSFNSIKNVESYWWPNGFIVIREGASIAEIEAKLPEVVKKIWDKYYGNQKRAGYRYRIHLQPLTSIHLQPEVAGQPRLGGTFANIQYLYVLMSIAFFIILIACINYMNLATARSSMRVREISLRKVVGSQRGQLIRQHLTESVLYSLFAFILAVGLTYLLLPEFNNLTDKQMAIGYLDQWYIIPFLLGFALIVGLLAGSYPAFYLTALKPVAMLKRDIDAGKKSGTIRKFLVIFQFAASIALIICSVFIYQQLQYVLHKDLGFDKEHVVVLDKMYRLGDKQVAFKEELKRHFQIINAGYVSAFPGRSLRLGGNYFYLSPSKAMEPRSKRSEDDYSHVIWADPDYLPSIQLELVAGRNFSPEFGADSKAALINEAAVQQLVLKEPIGKKIYNRSYRDTGRVDKNGKKVWEPYTVEHTIVGVVKNYHYLSLHEEIKPLVIVPYNDPGWVWCLMVRTAPGDLSATLNVIEDVWKMFRPDAPIRFRYIDEHFYVHYEEDIRFGKIVGLFTIMAIFIACLGIFGLASFTAERRMKEIGIRKALGASVSSIVFLLSKETTKWVIISCIIALPIAYWVTQKWLQNFAYRIEISIPVIILAFVVTFLIALMSVISQAIRAANTNPVDALRYE